jgi:ribonuclease P protein component
MRHTFRKDERLSKRGLIRKLFTEGTNVYHTPFRLTWMAVDLPLPQPVQVLMSVPKRLHHHATDRNLIRRRMKEAYRMEKHPLYETLKARNRHLLICISYTAKEILPADPIRDKIIVLLQRLNEENEKVTG